MCIQIIKRLITEKKYGKLRNIMKNYGKLLGPASNLKLSLDKSLKNVRKINGKVWDLDKMLEIFMGKLELKKQVSLTVKTEKGYEKSRQNFTTGTLYSKSKLMIKQ